MAPDSIVANKLKHRTPSIFRHHLLQRYCDAVDVILAFWNPDRDGGWATYEETRGGESWPFR